MGLKLIHKKDGQCLNLSSVKSYLRIQHDLEDDLLKDLIDRATTWVEEATGKTITPKTWQYTHTNNNCLLPNPPIIKILEVKLKGKALDPNQYAVITQNGRTRIDVPFSWKNRPLSVTYEAGYGPNFTDIPSTLQQAVLTTLAYLYENRSGNYIEGSPVSSAKPWIQYHHTYHMI